MSNGQSTAAHKTQAFRGQSEAPANSVQPYPETAETPLSEDRAIGLLKQPGLAAEIIEQIARNSEILKYRKVKLALAQHPHTPRHLSLPLMRQLYTFDLVQVALTPTTPADLKRAADEVLCMRMETISSGERLSLAHRASGLVAGALLMDSEARVVHAALENPRLTESLVIKAMVSPKRRPTQLRQSVITRSGPLDARFGSRFCAATRPPWPRPSNLPAGYRLRYFAKFFTTLVCLNRSKPTCSKIWPRHEEHPERTLHRGSSLTSPSFLEVPYKKKAPVRAPLVLQLFLVTPPESSIAVPP